MQFLVLFLTTLLLSLKVNSYVPVNSASSELEIRNRLSLYSIALDTKSFDILDQVFTPDVVVNYQVPQGGVFTGLPAVKAYLVKSLTGFVTQHTLSTTVVEVVSGRGAENDRNGGGINSTIYLVANYLGQGSLTGQAAFVYRKYLDS